jgi:hypothetical protein
MTDLASDVEERIQVAVVPAAAYAAVTDLRRMARWSPECIGVLVLRRRGGTPARFVGFNRRGPFVWFTTCRVVAAEPAREFAFDVTTFGLPVARWGYRFEAADGGTAVTEFWTDRRNRGSTLLGRIFTGKATTRRRPEVNRDGMRATLDRLKQDLESAAASA